LLGSGIAYLFNVAIGLIGFSTGIATFALTRIIFGINGSKIFSILNASSFVGWCFINGIVAATAMNAISVAITGYSNLYLWGLVMGVLQGLAAIFGREIIRKIGVIGSTILIVASVFICIVVMKMIPYSELVSPMSDEARNSIGSMLSLCIGVSLGWAPAAADFGRYAKDRFTAGWVSFFGLLVSATLFFITGTLAFIATGSSDPASQMIGMGLGWPFLLIIILLTITTNTVNLYTGAMSLQNAFREWLQPRKAILILAIIQVPLTAYYPLLDHAQTIFNFMSIIFGPIFSILVVDYYLVRKKIIDIPQMSVKGGIYWYTGGFHIGYIVIDVIGVLLYYAFGKVPFLTSSIGEMIPMMIIVGMLTYVYGKSRMDSGHLPLKAEETAHKAPYKSEPMTH
jgi:purine-cytosine permease-like protein